jgi:hypothetical protein
MPSCGQVYCCDKMNTVPQGNTNSSMNLEVRNT